MPIGTEAPNIYPADGPRNKITGTRFSAVEARGGSRLLNWLASDRADTFTLDATVTINTKSFDVVAGHTITAGQVLEFFEDGVVFQATVTNVATDTITIDKSLPYAFTASALGYSGASNMNVDGASTEVVYVIQPPVEQVWDIATLNLFIQDATAMDSSLFGGITALTEGVTLRLWHSATEYEDLAVFKSNADFFLYGGNAAYQANMVTGKYGLNWSNQFVAEHGGLLRLDGSKSERLEIIISETLTGLEVFRALTSGYILK